MDNYEQWIVPGPNPRRLTPLEIQRFSDHAWAWGQFNELFAQYPNEFVIVWRRQIIAHGTDLEQMLTENSTEEHPREQLTFVPIFDPIIDVAPDIMEDECPVEMTPYPSQLPHATKRST